MAIVQVQVNRAQEVDAILGIFIDLLVKYKSGESILQIGSEELAPLVSAITNLGQVSAELAVDPKAVAETVGARFGELVSVFI